MTFIKQYLQDLQKENITLSVDFKRKMHVAEQKVLGKMYVFNNAFLIQYLSSFYTIDEKIDALIKLMEFLLKLKYCTATDSYDESNFYEKVLEQEKEFFNVTLDLEYIEKLKNINFTEFLNETTLDFCDIFSLVVFVYILFQEKDEYQMDMQKLSSNICSIVEIKNQKYGDAILSPPDFFVKGSPDFLIKLQMNNKLTRILTLHPQQNHKPDKEDSYLDLLGYYYLLNIATL